MYYLKLYFNVHENEINVIKIMQNSKNITLIKSILFNIK